MLLCNPQLTEKDRNEIIPLNVSKTQQIALPPLQPHFHEFPLQTHMTDILQCNIHYTNILTLAKNSHDLVQKQNAFTKILKFYMKQLLMS